ncbi:MULTISPECIES: DUF29 domain-containing protein [Methylobacterium]|uniref:DUF29 domain-containing protein n=1 Tax=Methylobacterium thuringiense TaxID=1003091 RepID=A0ABQ4TG49_9HYPH|nr:MULTISPECIES: DUF29 domain-containing protein [Methylobacterium]TXN20824.1 DUF29 domain-containing protein [Methylobacterium sp. WL9]GJE53996.1 hypothetical protein EKPJFOCH_0468 [Methylobacterium thuringiense]
MSDTALKPSKRVARTEKRPRPTPYEDDLYTWVGEQVALLRAKRFEEIDFENVAEELSDVGAEQYFRLQSALELVVLHMLKWDHQPEKRSRSWTLSIAEHRVRVDIQLSKNPGLKSRRDEAVKNAFRLGRLRAAREMRRKIDTLPAACPYTWDDILNRPFALDGEG